MLDYIFIYPCGMGVAGAAWATVIGQILSLIVTLAFHLMVNPAIDKNPKYIRPHLDMIRGIYHIGLSAMLMQGLLSAMMLGVNLIFGCSEDYEILTGTFGIYYKIQQMALFACFGLSNTLITVVAFHLGMKNRRNLRAAQKYGILNSVIVSGTILLLFQVFAHPIAYLFGLGSGASSDEIVKTCTHAIRLASLGYVFMGVTVGIQGILQGQRRAVSPLLLSFCRLAVFVFPLVWLFTLADEARILVWLAFPIAEFFTMIIALVLTRRTIQHTLASLDV